MKLLTTEVRHPKTFLGIYFGIGFILYMYGVHDGSFLLIDFLVGTALYKIFTVT